MKEQCQTKSKRASLNPTKADKLFENLILLDDFRRHAEVWLKKEIKPDAAYKWVKKGLPVRRILGRLYVESLDEGALWLQRTSE